jgi:Methyltransferase domain
MTKKLYIKRLLTAFSSKKASETITDILANSTNRNSIYKEMVDFYERQLPWKLIKHRKYFSKNQRGFGEDAFHSMWYRIFNEFKPVNCLEIGVYRGQSLTLWKILANQLGYKVRIAGISPFSSAGDSVSNYLEQIDYLEDVKKNHDAFGLDYPEFCKEYSNSQAAKKFISQNKWDLIYIDGSHDYDVVCEDWALSIQNLSQGGIIVMDDSSLYFEYAPGPGSFAGHPGPSRVAKEIAQKELKLLGGVGHNNIFMKK